MTGAGSPGALAGLGVWRPAQQRARRGQEGTPGLRTRLKAAAPRLGTGPGGASLSGLAAPTPSPGRPSSSLSGISRESLKEPAADAAAASCHNAGTTASTPWPRPESRPPPDSPAPDPGICAAHSSQLLAESGAGKPCRSTPVATQITLVLPAASDPVRCLTMHTD